MSKAKEKKVDIFKLFGKMNSEDYAWVMALTDDELKTVSVYVLLMWIHGVDRNESAHLILTNQYVNQYVFHLTSLLKIYDLTYFEWFYLCCLDFLHHLLLLLQWTSFL